MERLGLEKYAAAGLPGWVPDAARHYLVHTELGVPIRALARGGACHPSTILRQVRRFENMRDDFLIDEALRRLGGALRRGTSPHGWKELTEMSVQRRQDGGRAMGSGAEEAPGEEEAMLEREARRVLRRLCEKGAVLAIAAEMDKAVVVRDSAGGESLRTAVVDRAVAQALALKDWIACAQPGRVARYRITAAGRAALSRIMAEEENAAQGFAEAPVPYFGAGEAAVARGRVAEEARGPRRGGLRRPMGNGFLHTPLAGLARRRDKGGERFLEPELVAAGERLREDFELAQMGARGGEDWSRYLTGEGGAAAGDGYGGSAAARARVAGALRELGPGLGDVVLRCCCYLEGLEDAEKRMGWSARSGKIVLRIALQRLGRHYEELGDAAGMIG